MSIPTDLASLRLLSLVSGFPEPKRSRRWLLMLQAFCDESAENDGLFVMAGYVAPVERWLAFNVGWQRLLDDPPGHPHKKMLRFKMRGSASPSGLRRAELFYREIEQHATAAFSVRIDRAAMKRALKRAKWSDELIQLNVLANHYYFAFKMVVQGLATQQEAMGLAGEPVDFIFDEHTSYVHCLKGWEYHKQAHPEMAKYLGAPPIFRKEEEYLPLQAADLYAWWIRKWAAEGVAGDGIDQPPFPWATWREIPRFHWVMKEDDMLAEFEKELAGLKAMFPGDAQALTADE